MLTDFLPTTKKEVELRKWNELDVILFSADAYIDHPAFGAAVIGRTLEAAGYRVAIVPQPDWHGDFRDFKKLGRPRLYFGISAGAMDSMVNKYTANKRLRSEDAYSPDGRHDLRPEYPSIVYSKILRQLYPDVPIVLGGIEASLRRPEPLRLLERQPSQECAMRFGCRRHYLWYGRKTNRQHCARIGEWQKHQGHQGNTTNSLSLQESRYTRGIKTDDIVLHSHEECLHNKKLQSENFRHIEEESKQENMLNVFCKK